MKKILELCTEFRFRPTFQTAFARFAAAIAMFLGIAHVQAFDFADTDLLVGFRQPSGNFEMVVNLGRATNFADFARSNPGAQVTITNYSQSMLSDAFSDCGDIHWSLSASL